MWPLTKGYHINFSSVLASSQILYPTAILLANSNGNLKVRSSLFIDLGNQQGQKLMVMAMATQMNTFN